MKDRLLTFMRREGLTAAKIAEITGVQPSTVSHILSGRNNPRFEFLAAIMKKYPALDGRWLMLGQGEMYPKKTPEQKVTVNVTPEITITPEEQPVAVPVALTEQSCQESKPMADEKATSLRGTEKIVFFNSDGTFTVYQNS